MLILRNYENHSKQVHAYPSITHISTHMYFFQGLGGVAVFTFTYQKKKEMKLKRGSDLQMKLAKAKVKQRDQAWGNKCIKFKYANYYNEVK